jgi:hypothetical protein
MTHGDITMKKIATAENLVDMFFFWISNNSLKKAQRGATLVHRKYTRERLKGARKEIQKIRKGNHSRG